MVQSVTGRRLAYLEATGRTGDNEARYNNRGPGNVPFTQGFIDAFQLADHFAKHGRRLSIATEGEYLTRADTFLGGPRAGGVRQCTRPRGQYTGDVIRYDDITKEFGVLTRTGVIKTYLRLDLSRLRHLYPTDLHYYRSECRRIRK